MNKTYDVFISYRRADGWVAARLLYEKLTGAGLSVFLDTECIGNVNFFEEIIKAIDSSTYFLSVLSSSSSSASSSIDRCNDSDDMVLKEIEHAYNTKTKDKIVTAAFSNFVFPKNIPETLTEHFLKNAINFNDNKHFKEDLNELFKMLVETNVGKAKPYQDRSVNKFYAEEKQDSEFDRLRSQYKLDERSDKPIYDKVLSLYSKQIDVLDVGCSNSIKTLGYFDNQKVSSIFGLDVNEQCISESIENSKKCVNKNIVFNYARVDLDSDDLDQKLCAILKDKKFHVIHMAYLLLHIKNVKNVLTCFRKYLHDDGTLIIVDVDDGLNICYPDKNGEYKKFDSLGNSLAIVSGNRFTGRSIYTNLVDAFYDDISLEKALSTNIGYTRKERSELFETWNSWIKSDYELALKNNPQNKEIAKTKKWIDEKYQEMKDRFMSGNFFYGCGTLIFLAHKGK